MATTFTLKSLLVPSKNISVDFPGFDGFTVDLAFLSRETITNIRKKSTKVTFKNRQPVDEINDDLFLQLYVQASVRGWKGFKLKYLSLLAPVDLTGQDPEAELEYTEENALFLMKSSSAFDSWISEQVTDLGNFQSSTDSK